jgi:hypothetical protein
VTFTRSRFVALALAAFLAAGGAAAQVLWLTIEGPQRVFTVQMPNKPEYKISLLRSPAGTAFNLHSYLLSNGPIDYVAQTETYPADVDVSQPRAVLQAALDAAAPYLASGKWDKIAWTQVQGAAAADASGTFKDGRIFRNLVVLKGRQFYSLGFRSPLGMDKITDADRFFASLKVTP